MTTTPMELPRQLLDSTAQILKCLGHPVRLQVLDYLERKGESTVTEIWEGIGLEQSVASQHLSLMRDKGILKRRRDGVHVLYSLGDPRALKVLACLRGNVAAEGDR